jgi:hypothetical protein
MAAAAWVHGGGSCSVLPGRPTVYVCVRTQVKALVLQQLSSTLNLQPIDIIELQAHLQAAQVLPCISSSIHSAPICLESYSCVHQMM